MSNTDDNNKTSDKAHVISLSTESTSITNNSIIGKLDFEAPLNNVKDVNTQNNNIIASINIQAENTYSNTSTGGNWSYDHTGGSINGTPTEKFWTTSINHNLQVNDPIIFTNVVSGATGYIINTIYYVKEVKSKTTLTLSDSIGGTIVDGISDSSGTWNASKSEMPTGLTMKINDIEKIKISKDGDITNSGDTIINQPTFDDYSISGLVGWWKLDESSGNTAIDSSGNGNNGTNNGATVTAAGYDGTNNGAYSFDGSNDYITNSTLVNSSMTSFFGRDAFTISLWINSSVSPSTTPRAAINVGGKIGLQWGHGQSQYWQSWIVQRGTSGQSGGAVNNDGYGVAKYTNTFILNTWYHIVGTFDGVYLKAYLNGSLNASTPLHGSGQLNAPIRDLYIGSNLTNSSFFNGSIDDVRIYNRVLTSEEVYKLYYKPEGNLTITNLISGTDKNLPVAYWKMDESTGTRISDSSGNNYHGLSVTGSNSTGTAYDISDSISGKEDYSVAGYDGTTDGALYMQDAQWISLNSHISKLRAILSSAFTISVWCKFKENDGDEEETIFNLYHNDSTEIWIYKENKTSPGTVTFEMNGQTVESTTNFGIDKPWYHLTFTFDNGTIKIFVNGILESSQYSSSIASVDYSSATFAAIGHRGKSPYYDKLYAYIDEFRIYNVALTGAEIKKIYLDSEQTKIGLEIQKNGFVGIGTSNPIAPLHIKNDNVEVTNDSYIDNKANACIALEQNASTWRISINNNDRLLFSNDTSSTTNIKGYIKSYSEHTTNSDLVTFTGQHRNLCNSNIDSSNIGLIVSSSGKFVNLDNSLEASINESLPIVQLSAIENDIKVFGVLCDKEDLNNNRNFASGNFVSVMDKTNQNEQRMFVNSLGEGAIWVSNKNGLIENGDFITSSNIKGYGVKQLRNGNTDNFLTNYTVAKITCDCKFSLTKVPKTIVKTINNEIQYDTNGDIVFINEVDSLGNQQLIYPLQTRFIDSLGNQLQDETDYNNRLNNGEMVYIACFVGCTYHCG